MSSNKKSSLTGYLPDILMAAAAPLLAYFVIRSLLSRLDPEAAQKEEAKRKANAATQKLDAILANKARDYDSEYDDEDEDGSYGGRKGSRRRRRSGVRTEDLQLNSYEQTIAMEVVAPEDIPVSFDDIGGLDAIIDDLRESVIYPLTHPSLASASSLLSAPSGVLLYGPPGCGKTMLAKALAHESGACFINLHISTLTEKWYGDSNKLVNAVFSLARKLQPAIVFIDEIDAVLGTRRTGEHEASGMVKAEFMTHWDGLSSSHSGTTTPQRILILGATNRIQDIDDAILRRMPKKFPVGLPNAQQRRNIFQLVLRGTKIDEGDFDLDTLVRLSAGLSGSDIKEACREAAMGPVREAIRENRDAVARAKGTTGRRVKKGLQAKDIRGVRTDDFFRQERDAAALAAAAQFKELEDVVGEVVNVRDGGRRVVEEEGEEEVEGEEESNASTEGSESGSEGLTTRSRSYRRGEEIRR
ncbi:AAA-domain-containing protein [Westerdykella ornata]|uniref:AAA-domain-containing protein n=1 Tax=Westerdykella ornata TaxID=318751 RepID=A0A6A6JJ06_WESOR|nr:AAA-domain-containing protein [Westerdykella ornata]KAF2275646.1 AAA-domain-containing protein [Westerdykella ornata]